MWHAMVLLLPSSPKALSVVMEEEGPPGDSVWWVLSPDGDVYPMVIGCPPLRAYRLCDDDGGYQGFRVRKAAGVAGTPDPQAPEAVHSFRADRAAGPPGLLVVARAIEASRRAQAEANPPSGIPFAAPGPLPAGMIR